jgi:hypothetical protein
MTSETRLGHVLELLDDESPVARAAFAREMLALGSARESMLNALPVPPSRAQHRRIHQLVSAHCRERIRGAWYTWMEEPEELDRLERGLSLLSAFHGQRESEAVLPRLLDQVADDFKATGMDRDTFRLARYLFLERGLGGNRDDFYAPENSDLAWVIENHRGIPISLVSIYMLVGARLGLTIHGCNWPGHFLAMVTYENKKMLVDCFEGGRFIEEGALHRVHTAAPPAARALLKMPASAVSIVLRVLNNLTYAYKQAERWDDHHLVQELFAQTEARLTGEDQPA